MKKPKANARHWAQWIQQHPWWSYGLFFLGTGILYSLATQAPLYAPYVVQPTAIDELIPLLPWSVPIYLSYFLVVPSFVVLFRRDENFGVAFLTIFLCVTVHLSIVNLFPSSVAISAHWDRQSHWLTAFLDANDTRLAAFPSGHVALPVCVALLVRNRYYALWATLITIATVTTKQHYLPDIFGGLFLGFFSVKLGQRFFDLPIVSSARERQNVP